MISSASDLPLLLEQHLERWGLATYRSATFHQVPQAYGLAPTLPVTTPKGSTLLLRASDLYGARVKGLASLELDQDRYALTRLGEHLVAVYQDWLTTQYSPRYRALTTDAQRTWLTQTVTLVITRHLLEHKWVRALAYGSQAFADPWVCSVVGHLSLSHRLPGELARLVHHIVRDPEQQGALITQFLDDLDVRMQGQAFVLPAPLSPLPEGVRLPFIPLFEDMAATPGESSAERNIRP